MTQSSALAAIYNRRSIREFSAEPVSLEQLREIIKAGSWAPSGLNNQPWRFVSVIDHSLKSAIAEQTKYQHIIQAAPALICVYIDCNAIYNKVKDYQATGACIQNMLLATETLALGAVWLGEILNNKEEVNRLLKLSEQYELMAVIAIGHPAHHKQTSTRKDLNELILNQL